MLLTQKRAAVWAAALGVFCFQVSAAEVVLKPSADSTEVSIGGKPFTTYYFGSALAKPYLMPLRTASGILVSRPFPVQNDVTRADQQASSFEPHQRPLYFGHGNINGLSFWIEKVFAQY